MYSADELYGCSAAAGGAVVAGCTEPTSSAQAVHIQ
jgi:hypothetical protein